MSENALIPLLTAEVGAESVPTCNARDLHSSLQVGRDFSTWIKDRIEQYGFVEGDDYSPVLGSDRSPNLASKRRGGQNRVDYHLTLDMAKELAMIENNEIGRAVRRYFIQCEKALRDELRAKAAHVLPIQGVKLMRDSLSGKTALMLHGQSQALLRKIYQAPTKGERQNMHYHLHQINLTLGVPTIDLDDIENEVSQPNHGE